MLTPAASVPIPVTVVNGGTGVATLTSHGVLVGEGTGNVVGITAGTNGQLLIGQTAADPAMTTVSGVVAITNAGVTSFAAAGIAPIMARTRNRGITLDATTRKLQLVLGAAKNTNDCPYSTAWEDQDATLGTGVAGGAPGNTNGVTAVDVVAAPGASTTQRLVKAVLLNNADLAPITLTLRYNDNGTTRDIWIGILQPGDNFQYVAGIGCRVFDSAGQLRQFNTPPGGIGLGRWLKSTVLTSASANHTTTRLTNSIFVRIWAGGGQGGGGTTGAAGSGGAGGGGSSGGYAERTLVVSPNTAYAYTCGAGGSTSGTGATGQKGTDSTFVVGTVTVTALGGSGGVFMGNTATILSALGGASPGVSTGADLAGLGQAGDPGYMLNGTTGNSGRGGNTYLGLGPNGLITQGTGNAATANTGCGGGGGLTLNGGASTAGGAGGSGVIIVDEYN